MATQHQVLDIRQRFAPFEDIFADIAPDYFWVPAGQPGKAVTFTLARPATQCFALVEAYDLDMGLGVLLDGVRVATLGRGADSGWTTRLLPLPDMAAGDHRLQFQAIAMDATLVSTAVLHWLEGAIPPPPFPPDADTLVLRGWVNLPLQEQLGGKPDGDTIWLFDAQVTQEIGSIGAELLADEEINRERPLSEGGTVRRLRIRLQGIDTPELHFQAGGEKRQNYGQLALARLRSLGGDRFVGGPERADVEVQCTVIRRGDGPTVLDPNGRVLGYVVVDGLNLNVELVRLGFAFPYLFDSLSVAMQERLRREAEAASAAAAGLWRDYTALPVEPLAAANIPASDAGPVNFPSLWRRYASYRAGGGEPGPGFVEYVRDNEDKALAVPLNGRTRLSELIDPATNRLLVYPWEPVFAE